MSKTADRKPLFARLKESLEEGIQFARGELELRTTTLPAPPPELRARDVKSLRRRLRMSLSVFARALNVSTRTIQSWEQGRRKPVQAALRLLQVLGARPELVGEVVGIPACTGADSEARLPLKERR